MTTADIAPVPTKRRWALQTLLHDRGLDGMIVTDLINIRYLTGFTGSNAMMLLPATAEPLLVTDGRYREQAAAQTRDVDIVVTRRPLERCGAAMQGTWAVETDQITVDIWRQLHNAVSTVDLVSADGAIETLRAIKDDSEIALLRQACDITTRALADFFAGPIAGRSERQLARDLQWHMYQHGADDIAFESIVAAGENSAIPHHRPGDRLVNHTDLLKVDCGARLGGYHADCTRTVVMGKAAQWQRDIYTAVQQSQQAGLDAAQSGVDIADVWDAAVAVLEASGWEQHFTTGLGHGVGLQIHEDPFIGPQRHGKLAHCMAVTMEPGVYVPGFGGVRIEDTFMVSDGGAHAMTTMTKDLVEIQ